MEIFFGESVQSYSSKTVQFSLALTFVSLTGNNYVTSGNFGWRISFLAQQPAREHHHHILQNDWNRQTGKRNRQYPRHNHQSHHHCYPSQNFCLHHLTPPVSIISIVTLKTHMVYKQHNNPFLFIPQRPF